MSAPIQSVTDFTGLNALKRQAREDQHAALEDVAKQFESLFLGMVLKSMRQASGGEGAFDNQQSLMFRDMYDQQMAVEMGKAGGIGLAEVITRQLGRGLPASDEKPGKTTGLNMPSYRLPVRGPHAPRAEAAVAGEARPAPSVTPSAAPPVSDPVRFDSPSAFVATLMPAAKRAAERLGVALEALLAQSALETGWGKHLMRKSDGSPAYNLFGIKADSRWGGERVKLQTLEYEQGVAVRKTEAFRAYDSWEQAFQDYAEFIIGNPRYAPALENSADPRRYLDELQKAGYATDPAYAEKIQRIMASRHLRGDRVGVFASGLK